MSCPTRRHVLEPHAPDGFPEGTRVVLPSGRTGTVIAWIGVWSKRSPWVRLRIRYDDGGTVQLLPKMVRKL